MKNIGEGGRSVHRHMRHVSGNANLPIGVHFRRHMRHVTPLSPVPSFDCAYFPSPQGCTRLAVSKDFSVRSVPLWQSILYPLPASEAGRVRRPRPWVAKTAATMVNITRLATASVQSRPCVPNLLKLWPSSQIMEAMGILEAERRTLNHVLGSRSSGPMASNTTATDRAMNKQEASK